MDTILFLKAIVHFHSYSTCIVRAQGEALFCQVSLDVTLNAILLCISIDVELSCVAPKENHMLFLSSPGVKMSTQVPMKVHSPFRESEPSTESRTIVAISTDLSTI